MRLIDVPEVPWLVDELYDPLRYRPVVVVSPAGDTGHPRVPPDALAEAVGEAATVVQLARPRVCWSLSQALPDRLDVYGGAVRIYWPWLARDDDPERHPLLFTWSEQEAPTTAEAVRRLLAERGFGAEEATADGSDPDEVLRQARVAVSEQRGRADRLSREVVELRGQVRSLRVKVSELERRLHGRRVYADPERQFRHELVLSWLDSTAEPDRDRWPLRPYVLGPDFVASLEAFDGPRDKVVSVCVDVVTRRAQELPGRQVRRHHDGAAGRKGVPLVRFDGAAAWRCNVQTNSPQAARLVWWELPGGGAELGKVAAHDDVAIR